MAHHPLCYPCFGCGRHIRRWALPGPGHVSRAYESHDGDGPCLGAELRLHRCTLPGPERTFACDCGFLVIEREGRRYLWPDGQAPHRAHPLPLKLRRSLENSQREQAIARKWYEGERARGGRLWDTHDELPAEPPAKPKPEPRAKPKPPPGDAFEWDEPPPEEQDIGPPPEAPPPEEEFYDEPPEPSRAARPHPQQRKSANNRGGIL